MSKFVDIQPQGAKFISGEAEDGRVRLTREDASVATTGLLMLKGTLVDLGDGTFDIVPTEE